MSIVAAIRRNGIITIGADTLALFGEGMAIPDDTNLIWGNQIPTVENPAPAVGARAALGDLPRLKMHLKSADTTHFVSVLTWQSVSVKPVKGSDITG